MENRDHPGRWPEEAECIVTADEVSAALDSQAERVASMLPPEGEVTAVVLMNGGMFPAIELTRRMRRPLLFEYVHATRYRGDRTGRDLQWVHLPDADRIRGHVLLIDDIFDEGYTLEAVRERLLAEGADGVTTVVLALKQHDRGLSRERVDDHALVVPDRYVFGCGMDLHGYWRQLDAIWAV
jgi:hypoxanthine phosphoribosyltransferase